MKPATKQRIAKLVGPRLAHSLAARYYDVKIAAARALSPQYRESARRIAAFKDRHVGKRCFIIGNGPSLNQTDLSLLKNDFTFGLNRIYLLFEKLGFSVSYFVSVNEQVIEQCAEDIARVPVPKFIGWYHRKYVRFTSDMMFVHRRSGPRFCTDIVREGVWEGATVTYVAMQIAYYMGFRNVVLIGVDHNFVSKGPAHQLVTSQGDDPNHFDPNYFGKGFRWELPNLETSEVAYRLAKAQFERAGGEIVDATVGGKLQVFRKVDYNTLF